MKTPLILVAAVLALALLPACDEGRDHDRHEGSVTSTTTEETTVQHVAAPAAASTTTTVRSY